jgi:hypothetical protein
VRKVTIIAAAIAIAAGVGIGLTLPAQAAVSQASPPVAALRVQSPAVLVSRGAAVTVPVLVVCSPGSQGEVGLSLTQRVGSSIASGFGSTSVTCTGDVQILQVLVTANNNAFRKASAVAEASMFVCDFNCVQTRDTRTIELTNKT